MNAIVATIRLIRPQHWVKNTLLFVPLLLAHEWRDTDKLLDALFAFFAFSAAASAIYVVNDLLDVEADRTHPVKCKRPFASGDLPLSWGPALAVVLLLAAFAFCWNLRPHVWQLLALYVITTTVYSVWIKSVPILDVILLASLYTLRLLVGGVATEVAVSPWLMALSLFLFTSLAFVKRFVEVNKLDGEANSLHERRRSYVIDDLPTLQIMGTISGYLSVVVMSLYITSERVAELYVNGWALWGTCPILLYWISRVWFLARRGELDEDPVVFAITDTVSVTCAVLVVLASLFAAGALPIPVGL